MKTNLGGFDYGAGHPLLEEIVKTLLDNNKGLVDNVQSIVDKAGSIYVEVLRGRGSRRERVETYQRVEQKRLRAITDKERTAFRALRRHSQMERMNVSGSDENLAALRMLKGNGYTVANAVAYVMRPYFDETTIVEVTKHHTKTNKGSSLHLYVLDKQPTYIKLSQRNNI